MSASFAVVGGGLSGVSCARELAARGHQVTLFEANDRLGGRLLTDEDGTDLGGAYFGPNQRHVLRAIDRYGLRMVPTPTEGKSVQSLRGVVKHYLGTIPPVGVLGTLELNAAMIDMERLSDEIDVEHPERHPRAKDLDALTCDEYFRRICPLSSGARGILATAVRAILCVELHEVSVLSLAWYLANSGGPKRVFETRDGLQDSKVEGGAGRLPLLIAREFEELGGVIRLGEPVVHVDCEQKPGLVVLRTTRSEFTCHAVAVCTPPAIRARMSFMPPMPTDTCEALKRWRPGHIIKTFLYYREPYWRKKGLNGTIVTDDGIVMVTFDDTKPDGSLPCVMGFCMARECAAVYRLKPEERCHLIAQHYARVFKDDRMRDPIRYKEKVWVDEPHVGGCYVGVPAVGTLTQFPWKRLAETHHPRIAFGGTEASTKSVGYMDGAVCAGERAACDLLRAASVLRPGDEQALLHAPPARLLHERPFRSDWIERSLPRATTVLAACAAIVVGAGWWMLSHA